MSPKVVSNDMANVVDLGLCPVLVHQVIGHIMTVMNTSRSRLARDALGGTEIKCTHCTKPAGDVASSIRHSVARVAELVMGVDVREGHHKTKPRVLARSRYKRPLDLNPPPEKKGRFWHRFFVELFFVFFFFFFFFFPFFFSFFFFVFSFFFFLFCFCAPVPLCTLGPKHLNT